MDNTKQDFEKRKKEIESYFNFLLIFDDDKTKIRYIKDGILVNEKINPVFQITLIANSFLILYNLIESTIRNSIIEIYEKIEADEITYETLSENLKKIWIKQKTDKLKENNFKQDTLRGYIAEIANDILNRETIRFDKDNLEFSGNLDARKIRDLADSIGFQKTVNGQNLVDIKNKRNRLAHGEHTFYDVGKDYTVNDVIEFKTETFNYLSDIITNIDHFISTQAYKIKN
uniref:MAE-28990/MAE-18760-like HEPN domain-containing protein n=1 Tax=Chlorobium chlorochromatii (strain CaD3) TaxID=340177 RepID=Q3AQ42_CHLCH